MHISLPLDHAAIERILPHRYPFLLVDKITELEINRRIVGIKNISGNDPYLSLGAEGALPPTILTEVVAQVGAILILMKPEDRQRLPLFTGIKRVRYRGAVRPGDIVVIEVEVLRVRSRVGALRGTATIGSRVVLTGTMMFAFAPTSVINGRKGGA
jgi:3-hydroxyacyl-[acyl-carrier-protein] dehydratase